MPTRQTGSTRRRWSGALSGTAAVVLALVLSACGSSSSSSTSSGASSASTGTSSSSIKLAVVTASTTQNAFQEMADGATAAAEHEGVSMSSSAPNGVNPTQEVSQFQAAAHTAKNGVAIMTTAPEDFVRAYNQAVEEKVPVVTMDAPPPSGSKVGTYVGNNNVAVGEGLATYILKKLPMSGEVVIGNDIPGLILLELRIKGIENVLKKERPNVKIVGPVAVGSEPAENYDHWSDVVKAHPHAIAYLAPGDQDAVSLFRIQKQTGVHYLVGACDVDPIALEAVKDGYVDALGDPYHYMKGYIAGTLLAEAAKSGKPLTQGWWNPGQGIVTSENVEEILKRESSPADKYAFFEPLIKKELADPSAYLKPLSALG
jgi:ABC-type sugar transport system substrate-binding protein